MKKYEIGDEVTILPLNRLIAANTGCGTNTHLLEDMHQYAGMVTKVISLTREGYYLGLNDNWNWSAAYFENDDLVKLLVDIPVGTKISNIKVSAEVNIPDNLHLGACKLLDIKL
jgi:hypothetical protein